MSATYKVSGMTCGGCVRAVSKAVKLAAPSAKVAVDLGRGLVTVEGDVAEAAIVDAIEGAGFVYAGRATA